MLLNLTHESGVAVIQPDADHLDSSNVRAFRDAVAPILAEHRRVLLDMSHLQFVDSAGVGTLISCLRTANERQTELGLCELSRPVRALFDLMRMHRVFDIHVTRVEAIRGMAA